MIVRKTKISSFDDALKTVAQSGCDTAVVAKLAKKTLQSVFIVDDIDNRAANILKQDALSCGTDVAVSIEVSKFKKGFSTAVICTTESQAEKLIAKISCQPFGLKELAEKLKSLLVKNNRIIKCAKKKIILKDSPLVMGIINLSDDSFCGDGTSNIIKAIDTAKQMELDGADIIDVGAESTRPYSKPIDKKIEIKKIADFLKIFRKHSKLPISVDTYKPDVAKVALSEGADIINDIYGLRYKAKESMAQVVADAKSAVVIMHMNSTPATMQQKKNTQYKNIVLDIYNFLQKQISVALDCGIDKQSVIVDVGIGFGKTATDNILLIKKLSDFKSLGYPILAGLSNKSFISEIAGIKNVSDRLTASITACIKAEENGADILRVHNVVEMKRALKISEAFRRA